MQNTKGERPTGGLHPVEKEKSRVGGRKRSHSNSYLFRRETERKRLGLQAERKMGGREWEGLIS